MAKLRAPLFSLGASQKLGDALVYFPWKGIHAVREYVIPTNPRSAAQQTQRGYMEDAVDEWHGAPYTALDVTAWNKLAGIAESAMSGFNRMVREFLNEAVAGNTWTRIYQGQSADPEDHGFAVSVKKVSGGSAPYVRFGTSKTNLKNSQIMIDQTGNTWLAVIVGLQPDTLYYFTVDVGTSGSNWGRLGIYQQKTLPAA